MFKELRERWVAVAKKIGAFQSKVILAFNYFVVIAPFALIVRLFSDPLRIHSNPSWDRLPENSRSRPTLESLRKQS